MKEIWASQTLRTNAAYLQAFLGVTICGAIVYLHLTSGSSSVVLRFPSIVFGIGSHAQTEAPRALFFYQLVLISSVVSLLCNALVLLHTRSVRIHTAGTISGTLSLVDSFISISAIAALREHFFALPPSLPLFLAGTVVLGACGFVTLRCIAAFR